MNLRGAFVMGGKCDKIIIYGNIFGEGRMNCGRGLQGSLG